LNSVLQEGGAGAFGAFKGALFESIIKLVAKGKGQEGGKLDVDLDQGRDALEAIFGIKGKGYKYADFKNSTEQKDKFISQVMTNLPVSSYPALPLLVVIFLILPHKEMLVIWTEMFYLIQDMLPLLKSRLRNLASKVEQQSTTNT
jgi:hypothetical protein